MATPSPTGSMLSNGAITVAYMPMTSAELQCSPPIMEYSFEKCGVPGGIKMWSGGGFYSPGVCFVDYRASCTQTKASSPGWPIRNGETVVRCIPS
jgi:hypothetical protein